MKRTYRNILALIAMTSAVACSQKEVLTPSPEEELVPEIIPTVSITVGAESEGAGTKTYLEKGQDGISVNWEEADVIAVYDNLASEAHEFTIQEGTIEGGNATFEGEVSAGYENLWAVYPSGAAEGKNLDGTVSVTVPAAQQIGERNVSTGALVTVAQLNEEGGFSFKNVCGLLAIEVTYDGVKTIKIEGVNLCGTAKVNTATGVSEVTDGNDTITVTPKEGTEAFAKGTYYIAVLPGTTPEGTPFKVSMTRKGGYTAVKTTDKGVTIGRNGGFTFGKLDAATTTTWECHITNKEELLAWGASESKNNDVVYLDADIDMTDAVWTAKDLRGTFFGQNHKIYNLVINGTEAVQTDRLLSGFFARVYGKAQDLVLGSADGEHYDGVSCVNLGATEKVAWCYAGGVAASMAGGTLENIKSFSTVELTADFEQKAKIGGIAGTIASANSKITNCINYGTVVNNGNTSTAKADGNRDSIGGITSTSENVAGVVISGCKNYGEIICNNPEAEFVGGIIATPNGLVAAGSVTDKTKAIQITISNCINYGNVTLTRAYKPSAGGIVGCLCAANIENCTNLGSVSSTVASELKVGGIAGKFMQLADCSLIDCTNGDSSDHTKGGITASTGTASAFIGGILGNMPAAASGKLTISGCKNYADLATTNAYAALGGFGGYWNASGCVVEMSNCENYGNVSNTSSTDAGNNNVLGGFVGHFNNASGTVSEVKGCTNNGTVTCSKGRLAAMFVGGFFGRAAYVTVTSCINNGNVTFSNPLAATNAMNVGGFIGYAENAVFMTDCQNTAQVQIAASAATGNGLAGGLAGNVVNGTIVNCSNSGIICVLNGYKGPAYVGGLAGIANGSTFRNNSLNTGTIYSKAQTNCYVGGILGGQQTNKITIDGCKNTGAVYAEKKSGQFLVGGIMGDGVALAAEVKNCVNEGAVSATQTAYAKQYFTVGGIVGRSRGASGKIYIINGCTNRGTVTVTANTDNQLCNAGGIVGETNTYSNVTNNTNEAAGVVTCVNNVEAAKTTRTAYAGGISGGDNESTAGNAGNDTVTGNTNYANVSAKVTNGATAVGAGGVFGMLQRTGTFTGNKVLGTVAVSTEGTTAAIGGAGAVMGYYAHANVQNISAEIQKTVTVNGTAYSSEEPASWLCPDTNAGISATYVD